MGCDASRPDGGKGPPPAQSVEEIQSRLSAKFHSMNAKPAGVRGSALDKLFNLQHIDLETAKAVLSKPVDKSAVGAVDAVRENTHLGIVCGVAEEQGKRDYMEDRSTCLASIAGVVPEWPAHLPPTCFFGVFDGHGSMHGLVGYEVAEYLRTHLAKRLFAALAPLAQEYLRVGQACKFCAACGGLAAQEGCDHLFDVAKRYADTPPPSTPTAHAIPLRSPGMSPALNALPAVTQSAAQYYARPDFSVLVRDVFLEFDKEVLAQNFVKSAGSTCTIATIFGDALVLANVGDSDAYLCRDGIARRLTVHHKAIDPQESKRIWQSGGVVLGDRVSGMLELSRDFGCPLIKNECPGLIPEPHVAVVELTARDEFLVIGSDGLFEVHRNANQLMHLIKETLHATRSVDETCRQIVRQTAASPFSSDNVTMLLVVFNQDGVTTGCAGAAGGEVGYASTFKNQIVGRRPPVTQPPRLHPCRCGEDEVVGELPELRLPTPIAASLGDTERKAEHAEEQMAGVVDESHVKLAGAFSSSDGEITLKPVEPSATVSSLSMTPPENSKCDGNDSEASTSRGDLRPVTPVDVTLPVTAGT